MSSKDEQVCVLQLIRMQVVGIVDSLSVQTVLIADDTMVDIEDVGYEKFGFTNAALVKLNKRRLLTDEIPVFSGDSLIPSMIKTGDLIFVCLFFLIYWTYLGAISIYIRTWGCSHNSSDSEYMAGLLKEAGYNITASKAEASLWILNSCTAKTPSEVHLENTIKEAQSLGKAVVVAGCVSQADPEAKFLANISVVGVKQIDQITDVVDQTLRGNCVKLLNRNRPHQKLSLPKMRRNRYIEVLAISSGCLNHCSYCKTKMARGNLVSFHLDELVEQARLAFSQGCREIWLTSEDLGAWGRDFDMVLPDLLEALVEVIPEGCMLRLGMTNPPYILDFLEEIAKILRHPRVYSFLHIPVQSGSDPVLIDMKREYSVADFCKVVDYMIENVPDVYIATDFICAFPTETEEDFNESMNLVKKYHFPSVFINQFFPRPGTPASKMRKVDSVEAKRRTAEMSAYFRSYSRYTADRIGRIEEVLVCERATDGVHYVGHNKSYEQILVPALDNTIMGKFVKVQFCEANLLR
uniref:tRNA-t(6)A37 methylthiotransferase n=1 Tax=Syphacia muris TaxID=451379 RepID=A0A0N5A9E3_9BILA